MCADPDIAGKRLRGEAEETPRPEALVAEMFVLPWCNVQIERMADGLEPDLTLPGEAAIEQFKALEANHLGGWLKRHAATTSPAESVA